MSRMVCSGELYEGPRPDYPQDPESEILTLIHQVGFSNPKCRDDTHQSLLKFLTLYRQTLIWRS